MILFTQNQLAIDLTKHHYTIQPIFTPELLTKHFDFNKIKIDIKNEIPFLIKHLGLHSY